MCTLTYVPQKTGYVLTSNRDEHVRRSVTTLAQVTSKNGTVYFPKDPLAGGSWIAYDDQRRVACLLNGAFTKHKHEPPYRISRGTLLLQSFDYANPDDFIQQTDFNGIEPFTILLIPDQKRLVELRWDGRDTFVDYLPSNIMHMWSSCTLYSTELSYEKELYFRAMLKEQGSDRRSILSLHRLMRYENLVENKPNDLLFTTSISQIMADEQFRFLLESMVYDIKLDERF